MKWHGAFDRARAQNAPAKHGSYDDTGSRVEIHSTRRRTKTRDSWRWVHTGMRQKLRQKNSHADRDALESSCGVVY
jgi:hypothetical protein